MASSQDCGFKRDSVNTNAFGSLTTAQTCLKLKPSAANRRVTGNLRKLSIHAYTSGLRGTVSRRSHEP